MNGETMIDKHASLEEPLRGIPPYKSPIEWRNTTTFQGPKRAVRLCVLCIVLPGLLIGVPLYLKHHIFAFQMYPVGMSDMRLIDSKVSTTWCQRQLVKSNATFNAFLMPGQPQMANERQAVSMTRHLDLSDDMKEYWGFYLLKGSTVTVSTCARWPGASLILIRGHRHLHECAYIGDDSSEELEELLEIAAEKGILDLEISSPESPSNRVDLLTKHRPEVQFHDKKLRDNAESYTFSPLKPLTKDTDDDITGKQMKALLDLLPHRANKFKANAATPNVVHLNRMKDLLTREIANREMQLKNGTAEGIRLTLQEFIQKHQEDHVHKVRQTNIGKQEVENVDFANEKTKNESVKINATRSDVTPGADGVKNGTSSHELLDEVIKKLHMLGADKRSIILDMLRKQEKPEDNAKLKSADMKKSDDQSAVDDEVEILDMDEPKLGKYKRKRKITTTQSSKMNATETAEEKLLREKREIVIKAALESDLNDDDEDENMGIEEGYVRDGIADHHSVLNHTLLNDRSNSEFWSSFSSSEEALLNCAGLILSLPLTPSRFCSNDAVGFEKASHANTITYTVPTNGYYFFVFSSENEVQDNYIRVHFNLQKTVYNVSSAVTTCNLTTNECDLPLSFFSNEKVVFELPVNDNETSWNEEYVVISECEPRTMVYLVCVLAVPLMVLLFAFQ